MKKIFFILLILTVLASNLSAASARRQASFSDFWTKFKSAVKAKNKNAVASLTKFPLSMPYGQASVKNKAQLAARYEKIFNGEADAAKCFAVEKPERENSKRYSVACGFKNDATGDAGKPVVFSFELTKTGWKFAGLDNINE